MEFDIEKQFRKYMEDLDIPISTLDAVSVANLKRSFVSGASAMFGFIYVAALELNAEEGKELVSNLNTMFTRFFDDDLQSQIRYNSKKNEKY